MVNSPLSRQGTNESFAVPSYLPPDPDGPIIAAADITGQSGRDILRNLTVREVRTQFKRTALGRIWSFINPLATLAILSVVFGLFLKIEILPSRGTDMHLFVLFLAAALIPWNFISGGIIAGMNSLVANSGLLTKVYFPRYVLPVAVILSMALTFGIEMGVVIVVTSFVGGPKIYLFIPAILLVMALIICFVIGVAMMLSVALVYFRDTQHFVSLFMQLWFYATPIIYPLMLIQTQQDKIQAKGWTIFGEPFPVLFIYNLNPTASFTGAMRSMIYDYSWPSWQQLFGCGLWAAIALGFGILTFRRFSARVVEEL